MITTSTTATSTTVDPSSNATNAAANITAAVQFGDVLQVSEFFTRFVHEFTIAPPTTKSSDLLPNSSMNGIRSPSKKKRNSILQQQNQHQPQQQQQQQQEQEQQRRRQRTITTAPTIVTPDDILSAIHYKSDVEEHHHLSSIARRMERARRLSSEE